jgi:septum formation protein
LANPYAPTALERVNGQLHMTDDLLTNSRGTPVGGKPRLVLASASPRRRDLLIQIGITADVIVPANVEEAPHRSELPAQLARRLSLAKADKVAADYADAFVLGADTVVACGRRVLPKAESDSDAHSCLIMLSGRRHRVYGGVTVVSPEGIKRTRVVTTVVSFKSLAKKEIDIYLASGEWQGKAGGYAIQGRAASFVRFISGSYTNVVGLPVFEVAQLLTGLGYK